MRAGGGGKGAGWRAENIALVKTNIWQSIYFNRKSSLCCSPNNKIEIADRFHQFINRVYEIKVSLGLLYSVINVITKLRPPFGEYETFYDKFYGQMANMTKSVHIWQ